MTNHNVHDLTFLKQDGSTLPLSQFAGKAVLVVNTASECTFRNQFQILQKLHDLYKDKGFTVLAVPTNSAGQERKTDEQIGQFCHSQKLTYPFTAKELVWGKYGHPFFERTRETFGLSSGPFWNFYKYLFAPNGDLVDFFIPFTSPTSERVRNAIEKVLP